MHGLADFKFIQWTGFPHFCIRMRNWGPCKKKIKNHWHQSRLNFSEESLGTHFFYNNRVLTFYNNRVLTFLTTTRYSLFYNNQVLTFWQQQGTHFFDNNRVLTFWQQPGTHFFTTGYSFFDNNRYSLFLQQPGTHFFDNKRNEEIFVRVEK